MSLKKSSFPPLQKIPFFDDRPLVNVITLAGVIGDAGPGGRGLSLRRVEPLIEAAFKPKKLAAVALSINSPGGSPVQSALILAAIRRAAKKKSVPVLSFIEDVGASGGYLLAIAGDEIYADRSSIVGSIGVISAGFGFQEAIAKLGIERRVQTAGKNKNLQDPFHPQTEEGRAKLTEVIEDMHGHFIDQVRERRGGALQDDNATFNGDLFSGAFWTAPRAQERGLIDGIGHLDEFIRNRFGEDANINRLTPRRSGLRQLLGGARAGSAASAASPDQIAAIAREWSAWAKFDAR